MMLEMTLKVVIMQGRSFYRSKLQMRVFEYASFFYYHIIVCIRMLACILLPKGEKAMENNFDLFKYIIAVFSVIIEIDESY
jgi:hypothetical protein